MPRHPLTSLGLAACLVLTPAGCGSSSGSSTSTSSTAGAGGTTQSSTAGATANSGSGADNSIQTYGSAATSTEKAALADSALSFLRASSPATASTRSPCPRSPRWRRAAT